MPDRIEKQIVIRAPRSRVWRALVDTREFGTWFGVDFPDGEFRPGAVVSGQITTPGYEHMKMDVEVVEVVAEERFSYRWDPYEFNSSTEDAPPKTLVTFTLEESPEGTLLRVVESGFDTLPPAKREKAYRENDGGWAEQVRNIERHVTASR